MNWVGIGTDLLKYLILAVKVFVGIVLLMLLYVVFNFIFGFKSSEFVRVALTSSAESDLIVTSFAQVDLLHLRNRRDEITLPSEASAKNFEAVVDKSFENAKAFCLHSYEVVFGYPSLADERKRVSEWDEGAGGAPLAEPEIVAINVLRSENAPDSSTLWCQQKNLQHHRDSLLREQLRFALAHDGVLAEHVNHGQLLLATTLGQANPECRASAESNASAACLTTHLRRFREQEADRQAAELQTLETEQLGPLLERRESLGADESDALAGSIDELMAEALQLRRAVQQNRRYASLGADVASIVLTFSTTLGVSEERKRFLGLWTSKRFYLQRDISRVYYGTRISPSAVRTRRQRFGPDSIEVVLPTPSIIAMDRYSSFVVARNKIEGKSRSKQSLANYLNQQILTHVERGITRFHKRAVEVAESIMVSRVPSYFGLDGVEYEVRFVGERSFEPNLEFLAGVLDLDSSDTEEPAE